MIVYQLLSCVMAAVILLSNVPTTRNKPKNYCFVGFTIDNAGIDVHGRIDSVDIKITRNGSNISSIVGLAYPSTIHTGIAIRDQHLKRSDYFDIARFPVISISSHIIDNTGPNEFVGLYDVRIKGITKRIRIPFHCTQNARELQYKGTFEIDRLDFSLGEESLILNNLVKISVAIRVQNDTP